MGFVTVGIMPVGGVLFAIGAALVWATGLQSMRTY
jgi:hypothetical protein